MKDLFDSGKLLVLDLASTFVFLVAYLLTNSIPLSVTLGMALGVAQIGMGACPQTADRHHAVDEFLFGGVFWGHHPDY